MSITSHIQLPCACCGHRSHFPGPMAPCPLTAPHITMLGVPFSCAPKSCVLHHPLPPVYMSYVLCVPRFIVCIFKICVLLLVSGAQQSLWLMSPLPCVLSISCVTFCVAHSVPGPKFWVLVSSVSTRLCTLESTSCVTCPMTFNPLSNVTCPWAPHVPCPDPVTYPMFSCPASQYPSCLCAPCLIAYASPCTVSWVLCPHA